MHGNILKGATPRRYCGQFCSKVIALIRYYAQNAPFVRIYNEDTTQISQESTNHNNVFGDFCRH